MPKTIFGTTEKSNFILNMKPQTVQKWICGVLVCCVLVLHAGGMLASVFAVATIWYVALLYAAGFTGILFFLIVLLRKDLSFIHNPSYIIVAVIALLSVVSYYGVVFRGGYVNTALIGLQFDTRGRYEGLLSLLAYYGVFLAATCVLKKRTVKVTLDVLVGAGALQSLCAILQHIPGLGFPTEFADLPSARLQNVMLSYGFTENPIFYGSFVTLTGGVALLGAVYDKNVVRARLYAAAAVLSLLTGLFTSSVVPIIGLGAALTAVTVIVAVNRIKGSETVFKGGLYKSPELRYAVLTGLLLGVFAVVYLAQGIYIRDKAIAYSDAFYRLLIVGGSPEPLNTQPLYEIAWVRSLEYIKQYPLTGVGPDCFALVQSADGSSVNSIDKSYNDYFYIAVTRGLPSLAAYLVLIYYAIKKSAKDMKYFLANSENWFIPAAFTAVTAYLFAGLWSAGSVTVSPFFWLLLGFICAKRIEATPENPLPPHRGTPLSVILPKNAR
jgi:hypothetical protein